MAHWHYHVSFWDGSTRRLDTVPYTERCFAEMAMNLYFRTNERPKVKRLKANHCTADEAYRNYQNGQTEEERNHG